MTKVTVRYFAAAADAAGCDEEVVTLAAGATIATLADHLREAYGPAMTQVLRAGSFLIDQVVRRDPTTPLGQRVDVLPPFAGG